MLKLELPIPIHQLALLQAYLYEIFVGEKRCEKDFKYTKWYLKENFTNKQIDSIFEFLKSYGFKCDCDIIKKLDLSEISDGIIHLHN